MAPFRLMWQRNI